SCGGILNRHLLVSRLEVNIGQGHLGDHPLRNSEHRKVVVGNPGPSIQIPKLIRSLRYTVAFRRPRGKRVKREPMAVCLSTDYSGVTKERRALVSQELDLVDVAGKRLINLDLVGGLIDHSDRCEWRRDSRS